MEDDVSQGPAESPQVSIVCVTYDRVEYLREFLKSLQNQDWRGPQELVLVDNGSKRPVELEVKDLLMELPGSVRVLRHEENLLSWSRVADACRLTTSPFILWPGDDDLLEPTCLRTFTELARQNPDATMLSAACDTIDEAGVSIGVPITPPSFSTRSRAIATLLKYDCYPLPATAFNRRILERQDWPRTRTSIDWWLWLHAWLAGQAANTSECLVRYRVHPGQEQVMYGRAGFALDGARMLATFVESADFKACVGRWTAVELDEFVAELMCDPRVNGGDNTFGPFLQTLIADAIAPFASTESVLRLYADASTRAGVPASPSALRALAVLPGIDSMCPDGWLGVSIATTPINGCPCILDWQRFLAMPQGQTAEILLTFDCGCLVEQPHQNDEHSPIVHIQAQNGSIRRLTLQVLPSEAAAAELLGSIAEFIWAATGRAMPSGLERLAMNTVRWIRSINRKVPANAWVRWLQTKLRQRLSRH